MTPENTEIFRQQAAKIAASGILGRSKTYPKLFDFLVENTLRDHSPKEVEIATRVFSRDDKFDPTQDSMVRVYAHNLRQKIRQYYEQHADEEPLQLVLPRGEYRLALEPISDHSTIDASTIAGAGARSWWQLAAIAAIVFGLGVAMGFGLDRNFESTDPAIDSPLWTAITDDELAVQIVVGDYYIFGERSDSGDIERIVREFDINSSAELESFLRGNPEYRDRYEDLSLTYLARSTAAGVAAVQSVLSRANKQVTVVPMSEFDLANVRSQHIVYIGYFSALDKLINFSLAASQLAIGETFDELWNVETGEVYSSEAGHPLDYRSYRDYGYFSTFSGPGGNQFVIVAGTRDEGVSHIAQVVTDSQFVPATVAAIPLSNDGQDESFELLYEVTGFDRTHVDAMLVHAARLDVARIWRGNTVQ